MATKRTTGDLRPKFPPAYAETLGLYFEFGRPSCPSSFSARLPSASGSLKLNVACTGCNPPAILSAFSGFV